MQNKLGNLDNLSLGMGLTAHPNQRIPARYASLDGYGTADTSIEGCSAPDNYVLNDDDCNDADALTYLGAPEVCSS